MTTEPERAPEEATAERSTAAILTRSDEMADRFDALLAESEALLEQLRKTRR